jgi:hypothetical protein
MPPEPSSPDALHIAFGLDVTSISSVKPSLAATLPENLSYGHQQQKTAEQSKDDHPNETQAYITSVEPSSTKEAWGEIFRESFHSEVRHQVFERILGCLKRNRYSIQINTLEKDLTYLSALNISKKRQLFISLPVSPVSLGILLVIYYAHLFREERDIYHTHHAISAKDFVIWIRPQDNGKISNLRTTRAFNLIEREDTHCALSEKIACLPAYKFEESSQSQRLRVVMVRSLSEAVELFKKSQY